MDLTQLHNVIFATAFAVIALNSLFYYSVLREKIFIQYFIMVGSLALHTSLMFLEPFDVLLIGRASVLTALATAVGGLYFTRSFIGFGKGDKSWWMMWVGLLGVIWILFGVQLLHMVLQFGAILDTIIPLLAAFLALSSVLVNLASAWGLMGKYKSARLYLYINTPMILSALAYIIVWYLGSMKLIGDSIWVYYLISGGMALQMLLFSIFVGKKIKNAEREKLELERDINKKLKEEVARQTQSLAEAKDEMESQRDRLKTTNDIKNKLFSLVAHDLRNPLNNLSSLTYLLEKDILDEETRSAFTRKTKMEITDSITVVERLLQWSYKQLDGISVNVLKHSLREALNEVLRELAPQVEAKGVKVSLNILEDRIYFDRDMLRVVLRNLISNAIKFSHQEGSVDIESRSANGMVEVKISDHGIGMNPDWYQEFIEKGHAEVKQGTKGEKGNGFGLIITKDFVEMNKGVLACESEPNKGTTFIFSAPTKGH